MTEPPFSGSEQPPQQPQGPSATPGGQYPPPYPGQQPPYAGQPAQYPPPAPGGYPAAQPGAAYGVDAYGRPLSDKSKVVAGILGILFGSFGVGRFYLGYTNIGVLQLVVSVVTCGVGSLWGLIDGIMILMGNVPDAQGRTLRD